MIKLADAKTADDFFSYCASKPFGIKLEGMYKSYGNDYSFADFWLAYDDSSNLIGVIARLGGAVTLCCERVTSELADFIKSSGAATITGEEKAVGEFLGLAKDYESDGGGFIMELREFPSELPNGDLRLDFEPSAYEFCKLLSRSEGKSIRLGDFDDFYADVSHRVRRGTALNVMGFVNNDAVSTASAVAISEGGAFIGAVSVREDMRKKSYGYKTVSGLLQKLKSEKIPDENKKAYLLRADGENEEFYEKLGFRHVGRWAAAKVRR